MPGPRLLSQRISEGDGIAIIAQVDTAEAARLAEQHGAKAVAASRHVPGIREATSLPLLWLGPAAPAEADACAFRPDAGEGDSAVELVAEVRDGEELEDVLERFDPEIFMLVARPEDDDLEPLDAVLELLPDVPAGKLAIAHVEVSSRDEVLALERAGMDAVLVPARDVPGLVGHTPLDV